nr:YmfL family putative regulatory protein [Providencia sp.]
MCKQTLKEVVKEMCKAFPGGRSAMAGALGMTETTFNNNLYEKNGCRFFEREELEAMEDLSNTSFLAEYYANRRNLLLVEKIKPEDLDEPELFRLMSRAAGKRGELAVFMDKSLEDGKVDGNEESHIMKLLDKAIASGRAAVNAFIKLHKKGWRPRYAVRGVGC